jgi:uncharacterized protein YjbI with pentapeptide repeats
LNNVLFKDSNLSEASFLEAINKNLIFDNVDLYRAEFVKINLNDVDFSNSDISGVMFDMNSLRGIVVDEFQCKSLITMFGVNVK